MCTITYAELHVIHKLCPGVGLKQDKGNIGLSSQESGQKD